MHQRVSYARSARALVADTRTISEHGVHTAPHVSLRIARAFGAAVISLGRTRCFLDQFSCELLLSID
jgi:hypothetical protein